MYGGKNEKSMRCNLGVIITVLIASSMRVGSSNTKEEYERINEEPSLPHSGICSKKNRVHSKKEISIQIKEERDNCSLYCGAACLEPYRYFVNSSMSIFAHFRTPFRVPIFNSLCIELQCQPFLLVSFLKVSHGFQRCPLTVNLRLLQRIITSFSSESPAKELLIVFFNAHRMNSLLLLNSPTSIRWSIRTVF